MLTNSSDMATRTTYLLISGISDLDHGRNLPVFSEYNLEHRKTYASSSDQAPALKYAIEEPLEEAVDLSQGAQALSKELPEATVLLCDVEERFDQIDNVHTVMFIGGKRAGEIEHGHVFNVGGRQ